MIYKASNFDSKKLISLPETGMGYQIFEAKRFGISQNYKFIAYNAELLVELDSNFFENRSQIIKRGFSKVLNESKELVINTESIKLITKDLIIDSKILSEGIIINKKRYTGRKGAKENEEEKANGSEIFVRLSAYQNDHRIDFSNKRLIDGSYSTTKSDYIDCVSFKDDPVDRYALPYEDGETVNYAFYIQPKIGDILQRGIVQPAFGHYGGGIEAYFKNGTSNNTYLHRKDYGE